MLTPSNMLLNIRKKKTINYSKLINKNCQANLNANQSLLFAITKGKHFPFLVLDLLSPFFLF